MTDLLQGLLHLLEVRLLVEVRCHDLGKQCLQDIGKGEEQQAAQQARQRPEDILHLHIGQVLGVEAAHKQRGDQRHTEKPPQGFLQ